MRPNKLRQQVFLPLVILLTLMPVTILLAQSKKGIFEPAIITSYSHADGLPQNSINDFCFDNFGYMWIATSDGLSRFDGHQFLNDFSYNISFPVKMRVSFIYRKNRDTLYAITNKQQLFIIAEGRIVGFEPYSVSKHGLLLQGSQSCVPLPVNLTGEQWAGYFDANKSATGQGKLGFVFGKDSVAILGKSMLLYSNNGGVRSLPLPYYNTGLSYEESAVYLIDQYVVFLNTTTNCLDVFNTKGEKESVPLPDKVNNLPWKIYRSTNSNSFFAANGGRLYQVRAGIGNNKLEFIKMLDNFQDSIHITFLYNLDDTYLIATTQASGLYVYHKKNVQTFAAPIKKVKANYLYAQALMPDGKTILTGVNYLFDKNGFKGLVNSLEPAGIDKEHINYLNRVIFKDRSGFYWYLQQQPNLFVFDLMKAAEPGAAGATKICSITNGAVFNFFQDKKGNIWFNNNGCLGYLDKGSERYITLLPASEKNSYVTQNIRCYAERNDGKLIIGTTNGAFIFDPKNPEVDPQKYFLDNVEITFLNWNEKTGALWIGTYGKGLWILKNSGELEHLTVNEESNLSTVHYALTDAYNRIWISSNSGLYVTSKENIDKFETDLSSKPYFYKLSTYDGFADDEFNTACQLPMVLQSDGSLTISSIAGLGWLNINDLSFIFQGKTLHSTIISGKKIFPDNTLIPDIEAGDKSELLIDVMAPDWGPLYNKQLQYRIIKKDGNNDSTWKDVNTQHRIVFPFLASGNYEIQLRKRTGFGEADFIYQTIKIHKKLFWYQTTYLYLAIIALLTLLGYLFYWWRTITLKRKNKVLMKKIAEATTKLQKNNEELLNTVKTRDILILLFNHDLSTPLFFINRLAHSLADADALKQPPPEGVAQLLANSTQDLEEMMNEMLIWIQLQQKNVTIQLKNEPVNIKELVEKNFYLFRHSLRQYDNIINYLMPDDILVYVDRKILNSILFNLISNAIKYTANGIIQMKIVTDEVDRSTVALIIQSKSDAREINDDDPAKPLKELNDVVENYNTLSGGQSRHIGLQLVKSFAVMLKVKVEFDYSAEGIFNVKISGLKLWANK
jgi:signal transduction histidine kinase